MATISTRDLLGLPEITGIRLLTQSLATLDAILCPKWEYRYYSFNSKWAPDEMMASMRNGSGDEWFILFNPCGAAMKGFSHEMPMADGCPWEGVISDVPSAFQRFLNEPAFSMEYTTFCIWRAPEDRNWQRGRIDFPPGPDPDGSEELMRILDGKPETYKCWAEEYYEVNVDLAAVTHIYQHHPVTMGVVSTLNPELEMSELTPDLLEIGYPSTDMP